MGKRNRKKTNARRTAFRDVKPLILVVSEGKNTEPQYIRGFAKSCHNPRVKVKIIEAAGVPKTIVSKAKELKLEAERLADKESDDNIKFDEVWCVFDVDEHPNIPDAKQMARDNGLHTAISNPCIEIWLWLHFADQPGARNRHKLQRMMKKHVPNYDKSVNFNDYADGIADAIVRAKRLEEVALQDGEEDRNPTTGFWRLVTSIRDGA